MMEFGTVTNFWMRNSFMASNFYIDEFFIKYSLQHNSEKLKFPLVGDYAS